ncbi:MAG: hypothetical protein R3E82_03700 [Pseudomonadales bacterium]
MITPVVYAAWDDPRARGNPCAAWQDELRTRRPVTLEERHLYGRTYLYDGVGRLESPMDRTVSLPSDFTGDWKASCVIFEVVFSARDGVSTVSQATPRLVYPNVRSDLIAVRHRAAENVLRQIPVDRVLANKPVPGVPQLIAVPLWPDHPFYNNDPAQVAGPVKDDLEGLGYSQAESVGGDGNAEVYKVFDSVGRDIWSVTLVVIRTMDEQEPLVRIAERADPGSVTEQVPEGPIADIFDQVIGPWLQRQAGLVSNSIRNIRVEVRHYARGLRIDHDRFNAEASMPFVADPRTAKPVAHPLLVSYDQGRRYPGVQSVEWHHRVDPPRYATIVELKQLLAAAQAEREDRAQNAEAARKQQQTVLAERRAQRLRIQAERSPNYVYKSDYFWASLPRFYIPQQVFNGDFGSFQINTQFPRHYRWFLEAYSSRCEKYITQKPHMKRTIVTQTVRTDRWGFVTSTGPVETREIFIEASFWPKYEEYERVLNEAELTNFASFLFSDDIDQLPESLLGMAQDRVNESFALAVSWRQFFPDERTCTSPTVFQMHENMLRAANGLPSLQKAGTVVPNAASETEPLVPPPGRETIFDGCYQNHDYKDAGFCMCMDRRSQGVMRPEQRQKYAADFSLYYSEIVFPDKGGLEDARWPLYDLLKQCKQ